MPDLENSAKEVEKWMDVKELSKLDVDRLKQKLKKISEQQLPPEQLLEQIKPLLHVANIAIEGLKTLSESATKAGDEGVAVQNTSQKIIDALTKLCEKPNLSSEDAAKIADHLLLCFEKTKEMNRDNKKFWSTVVGCVTFAVALPVTAYIIIKEIFAES